MFQIIYAPRWFHIHPCRSRPGFSDISKIISSFVVTCNDRMAISPKLVRSGNFIVWNISHSEFRNWAKGGFTFSQWPGSSVRNNLHKRNLVITRDGWDEKIMQGLPCASNARGGWPRLFLQTELTPKRESAYFCIRELQTREICWRNHSPACLPVLARMLDSRNPESDLMQRWRMEHAGLSYAEYNKKKKKMQKME